MKHIWLFLLKILTSETVAFSVLPMFGLSAMATFWIGLGLAVLLYPVGDLFILPRWGNAIAVIADSGVAFVAALTGPRYLGQPALRFLAALVFAAAVGLVEYYFHRFVMLRARRRVR